MAHPKPKDKLLGLIGDNNTPADETTIVTSENDIIITDNEIKGQKQRRKEDSTTEIKSMPSIWKRKQNPC